MFTKLYSAVYLRHKCPSYKATYEQLQDDAREMLRQDGREADWEEERAIGETIHQIIKNRIQKEIATRFPELAKAAEEQML